METRTDYELLARQVSDISQTESNYVSVMSNTSAILMETLDRINWAGFYIVKDGMLKVGPFQGRPACILIGKGKGVCGTAWERDETVLVPDVHAFPGHIACDSASRSEIVVPIHRCSNGKREVAAVLDIDSPVTERFSAVDASGLEKLAGVLEEQICWE